MTKKNYWIKVFVLVLLPISILHADAIYKHIDKNGRTTYSTTPPVDGKDAAIINITPPPSAENIDAARRLAEKNNETAKQIDASRKARNEVAEKKAKQRRENYTPQKTPQGTGVNDSGYPYYPRRHSLPYRPIVRPRR